ncbi:hypothetical protein JKP88DRAFT_131052, partial [Tribonema minus]
YTLHNLGYTLVTEDGDGACLFRAIARYVFNDPSLHHLVRTATATYNYITMTAPMIAEAGTPEQYYRSRLDPRTWGDNVEVQGAAALFGITVVVFHTTDDVSYTMSQLYNNASQHPWPLVLSLHGQYHYNSLL